MKWIIPWTAEEGLRPVVAHYDDGPGNKSELARKLTSVTGRNITRQQIDRWLHPDPDVRMEPRLDIGLKLIRLGHEAIDTFYSEHNQTETEHEDEKNDETF